MIAGIHDRVHGRLDIAALERRLLRLPRPRQLGVMNPFQRAEAALVPGIGSATWVVGASVEVSLAAMSSPRLQGFDGI